MLISQRPQLTEEYIDTNRSKFVIEPLEPGFGYTIGNALRRSLLSSIPGAAVTSVRIDGVPSAAVLSADRWGRPLPSWQQCRRLRPGELFLLSVTNPASFDSRYFGPVSASAVIGVAHPVWLETRP